MRRGHINLPHGYVLLHVREPSRLPRQLHLCGGYVTKGTAVCRRLLLRRKDFEDFVLDWIRGRLEEFLGEKSGRKMLDRLESRLQSLGGPRGDVRTDRPVVSCRIFA